MGKKQKKKQPVAHHNQPKNQSGFGGTKKNQEESRKGLQQVEHPSSRPIYNKHEICVRGLSPEIKNSELLDYFEKIGKIFKYKPVRECNRAYIEYCDSDDVKKALKLDGSKINGVTIIIGMQRKPELTEFDPKKTMEVAHSEFKAGHYQQASEKAWLAVDQALKKLALAKDKPIKYLKKHVRKREFADFLGEIDSDIPWLFAMAEQLHDNFYDGTLQSEMITLRFEQIEKKLFGKLDKFEKDGEVTLNDFFDKYPQK